MTKRFIDAEDFYKRQAKRCNYNSPIIGTCTMDNITLREALKKQPTAEVAPKSEVAREIFKAIEEVLRGHTEGGYYLNGVWFPERLDVYTKDAIAELKKKYTEGE